MRDKVNVLYYPESIADELTLKKTILFFDEIHFMDRPSFSFEGGLGSIGAASPLRNWEHLFKRDNVPVIIHEAPAGRMAGELLEQVAADVNDPVYLERFQAVGSGNHPLSEAFIFRKATTATAKRRRRIQQRR